MTVKPNEYFSEGDHVKYYPVGAAAQTSTGTIERIITEKEVIGTQVINANNKLPFFLVRNDHTGKSTAYRMENIIDHV